MKVDTWNNDCAASPVYFPDCRFCGAVGHKDAMRKWSGVPRTIFLHKACEKVLEKRRVITETWYGERRMDLSELDKASVLFFGRSAPSLLKR